MTSLRARLKRFKRQLAEPKQRRAWLATMHRAMLPHVTYVGITGSCAKTTTTRLIGTVLEAGGRCRTMDDNGISHTSRTVLSVGVRTRFCVQEIAGDRPGMIRTQTRILRPQIGVVTNVGGDHYKNYRSLEATAEEKGRLVEDLPRRGIAILNADDPNVRDMAARTRARVVTFGVSPGADVRATGFSSDWPNRLTLTVTYGNESQRLQTRLVGDFWTTSVLAAIACGVSCGLDLKTCAAAIERVEPKFGRYSVHQSLGGPVFIFDHKAPAWTLPHCFAFLASASAPRKTIVFGTLSDYPNSGSRHYRRVARQALDVADRVAFVGQGAGYIDKLRHGEVADRLFGFQTAYEASDFFKEDTLPDELILLKGSMFFDHLERIMLSQFGPVVCWKERCRKKLACPDCPNYAHPHAPASLAKSPVEEAVLAGRSSGLPIG